MAKRITQETFDAVVKENQEEFDLSLEDALKDAVHQFETQGIDLSNIITSGDKNDKGEASHPVLEVLDQFLMSDVDQASLPALTVLLAKLQEQLRDPVAHKLVVSRNPVQYMMDVCIEASTFLEDSGDSAPLIAALSCLAALLEGNPDIFSGLSAIPNLVVSEVPGNPKVTDLMTLLSTHRENVHVLGVGLRVARFACVMHEINRLNFVKENVMDLCLSVLDSPALVSDVSCVSEATRLLRALTIDDDIRVPFGKGHDHAKLIAEKGGLKSILEAAKRGKERIDVVSELLLTLAKLAVRDEFCKEIFQLGGLDFVNEMLLQNDKDPNLAFSCISVLKAIAGNDDVKVAINDKGGIGAIIQVMQGHLKNAQVVEQGCAALAAVCLRNPTNAKTLVLEGGVNVLTKSMQVHPLLPKVQKQACMAIRNIVSRNPDLKDVILSEGAEELINLALRQHKECGDEAKGALRDLGCKVELRMFWKGESTLGTGNLDLDGTVRN